MVYKLIDKKTSGGTVKNEIISNKQFAGVLHKPTVRKFEERKVHSPFIDRNLGHRSSRHAIDKLI